MGGEHYHSLKYHTTRDFDVSLLVHSLHLRLHKLRQGEIGKASNHSVLPRLPPSTAPPSHTHTKGCGGGGDSVVDRFYIALFSALEQTHRARM